MGDFFAFAPIYSDIGHAGRALREESPRGRWMCKTVSLR